MQRGRPRNFDKAEALDAALQLFWKHGYEGTSMAMLTELIGVNVASLYAAFGNKESLFVQCVERYSELNGDLYHESLKKRRRATWPIAFWKGKWNWSHGAAHPMGA